MSGLPSDEVAEDYKGSLDDLVTNDRYQISNLTLIAKENVEHAEAISRVLQNHIKNVAPARKLPALYVLDSIAKNVGSPYTVYFGRNLDQTFMLAYSQVSDAVRRKFEEMLKTWREPVPGSTSNTSVFPLASTQPIIDKVTKFRAATAGPNRGQPARVASAQPYRQTPTPPQHLAHFNPANMPSHIRSPQPPMALPQLPYTQTPPVSYTPPYPAHSAPAPYYQPPLPMPPQQFAPPPPQPTPVNSGVNLQKLHADIDDLTTDAKIACATHPLDAGVQRQLSSLQTLKEILDSGSATGRDLVDIQNTIVQKMAEKTAARQQAPPSLPTPTLSQAVYAQSQMPVQHTPVPPLAAPPTSLFNSTNLAELLRSTTASQQPPQPMPNYYNSGSSGIPPPQHSTPAPAENPFIAQLRASGLLSATSTPPQGLTPPMLPNGFGSATIEIKLTSASIKIARPQMVSTFLSAKPNQCSTCGRRFRADEAGKEKKARHLDWHFKTKARGLESERRGQNRSWYVDEREWIATKESEDAGEAGDELGDAVNGAAAATKKKAPAFVKAPKDAALRNLPCPIDQEPFKSEWSEEEQEWIIKDAILVGSRIYHVSCYNEVTKGRTQDGVGTPVGGIARTSTPDSVLGKRKAEEDPGSVKSKIKLESASAA